jgi:hypothetical protein
MSHHRWVPNDEYHQEDWDDETKNDNFYPVFKAMARELEGQQQQQQQLQAQEQRKNQPPSLEEEEAQLAKDQSDAQRYRAMTIATCGPEALLGGDRPSLAQAKQEWGGCQIQKYEEDLYRQQQPSPYADSYGH